MSVTSPTFQHFIGPYIDSAVLLSSQNRATASRSVAFVKTGDVISRRHSSSMALCPFTTASAAAIDRSRIGARAPIISTTWGSHRRRLAGSPDAIEPGAASKLVCQYTNYFAAIPLSSYLHARVYLPERGMGTSVFWAALTLVSLGLASQQAESGA